MVLTFHPIPKHCFSAAAKTYMVVFETSFMLVRGSEVSGQRRRHGANTMAKALGDMRFTSSIRDTLQFNTQEKKL